MRQASRLKALGPRLGVLAGLILADRLSKIWAQEWLLERASVPLAPFFRLTYVENTGAAFGLGRSRNALLSLVAVGLLAVLVYLQKQWAGKSAWVRWGLLLVTAGALSNLYDRLAYGFVVDYLDFLVWPVFNLADSCISVGAGCLAWGLWQEDRRAAAR